MFRVGTGSAVSAARRYCSGSMHSSDIAFKPNEDGWGYNKNYGNNFDKIFGKKEEKPAAEEAPKAEKQQPATTTSQ